RRDMERGDRTHGGALDGMRARRGGSSVRSLIVSLHDVAPPHLDRLRRAEALFRKLGVARVQYLFVPDFHGKFPATRFSELLAWCREPRPFEVSWWLHGYYHLDRASR